MSSDIAPSGPFTEDHQIFRKGLREFIAKEGMPAAKRLLSDLGLKAVSCGGVSGLAEPSARRAATQSAYLASGLRWACPRALAARPCSPTTNGQRSKRSYARSTS